MDSRKLSQQEIGSHQKWAFGNGSKLFRKNLNSNLQRSLGKGHWSLHCHQIYTSFFFLPPFTVCQVKSHKFCALRANKDCKWNTLSVTDDLLLPADEIVSSSHIPPTHTHTFSSHDTQEHQTDRGVTSKVSNDPIAINELNSNSYFSLVNGIEGIHGTVI